ncbi:related to MRPS5 - mitochondrial ribosomal protein, small subunit [Ustilago sp. UG-2017b]|nr:related to MRPS5 - mitochondrial ribosomal protein, small subunit [Ustilago sp. UG-2017b]
MAASTSCRKSVAGLLVNLSLNKATASASPSTSSLRSRCFSSSATSSHSSSSSSTSRQSVQSSASSSWSAPSTSSKSSSGPVKTIPASSPLLDKPLPINFPSRTLRAFPSLLHFADPVLDPHPNNVIRSTPTSTNPYPSTITFFNEPKMFEPTPPSADSLVLSSGSDADEVNSEQYLSTVTPLSVKEVRNLHRHAIVLKRVVHMTTKGKDASMYALVIAGNGNGLVGYGEGKDTNASKAGRKAFHEAVKNLDSVGIHKGSDGSRTIETQVEAKWGASRVVMRPRPAGFGLRVPPVIHAICRSVGITDLSASIYGSTNPVNVVKAALQILWGGAAPLGMGDGVGGQMRRKDKGRGMRGRLDIQCSRGRRIAEVNMAK